MDVAERRSGAVSRWLLCAVSLLLLLMVRSSVQEEIYFVTQPQPYYYSLPGHITHIQCEAIRVDDTGEQTPIDATLYRDGVRLVVGSTLPPRHELVRRRGVISGVIVRETQLEDVGERYWCQVEREGEIVAVTIETHILVGDGRPLPVTRVEELDQGLYSALLEWNEAPVPTNSPIQGYEITVLPQDRGSAMFVVEVGLNRTSVELGPLEPGSAYLIAIAGVNSNGVGNLSEYQSVMTLSPEVPDRPTDVRIEVVIGTTSTSIIVSWTPSPIDPEVMTPVTRYIIYYGQEGEELSLSKVVEVAAGGGQVSECIVTGVTMGGAVRVGVAAVNSAGSTEVAYYPHTIVVGCTVLSPPEHGLISQSGLSANSTANYSCKQGFTLTGNKMRLCLEEGVWTGNQPTCTENSPEKVTFLFIIIISLTLVVTLVVVIIVVCVLIVVFRRKYTKIGRKGNAVSMFNNASPPLKHHKKSRNGNYSLREVNGNETAPESEIGLNVLSYNEEPRAVGTPPPPDPMTFQAPTPSPSSPAIPPSYSGLENCHDGDHAISSNRSDGSNNGNTYYARDSSQQTGMLTLSVSYSTEPRSTGSTPSPHPLPSNGLESSGGGSDDTNSTDIILN